MLSSPCPAASARSKNSSSSLPGSSWGAIQSRCCSPILTGSGNRCWRCLPTCAPPSSFGLRSRSISSRLNGLRIFCRGCKPPPRVRPKALLRWRQRSRAGFKAAWERGRARVFDSLLFIHRPTKKPRHAGAFQNHARVNRSVAETVIKSNASRLDRFAVVHPAIHCAAGRGGADDAVDDRCLRALELHQQIFTLQAPVLSQGEFDAATDRKPGLPFIFRSLGEWSGGAIETLCSEHRCILDVRKGDTRRCVDQGSIKREAAAGAEGRELVHLKSRRGAGYGVIAVEE